MGTFVLAVNTVGRLGSGFGTTMLAGLGLIVVVFMFISLKDNPTMLAIILVIIGIMGWFFFGDMFLEALHTLRSSI